MLPPEAFTNMEVPSHLGALLVICGNGRGCNIIEAVVDELQEFAEPITVYCELESGLSVIVGPVSPSVVEGSAQV